MAPLTTAISFTQHPLSSSQFPSSTLDPLLLPQLENDIKPQKKSEPLDFATLICSHFNAFESAHRTGKPWTWKRAAIEVFAVRKAFPLINHESSIQAMTAWFHLLCHVDDEIEKLSDGLARTRLQQSIHLLRHSCVWRQCPDTRSGSPDKTRSRHDSVSPTRSCPSSDTPSIHTQDSNNTSGNTDAVLPLTESFIDQIFRFLQPHAIRKVAQSVITVWQFMCVEVDERTRTQTRPSTTVTPEAYLALRTHTIGLEPFFTILETLLLDKTSTTYPLPYTTLTASMNLAVGLQNDIIGLENDIAKGEQFNLILLLCKQNQSDEINLHDSRDSHHHHHLESAHAQAIAMHNNAVRSAVTCYQELLNGISRFDRHDRNFELVAKCMLVFLRTHYAWATHSRRYQKPEKTLGGIAKVGVKQAVLKVLCYRAQMRSWSSGTGRGGRMM